MEELEINKCHLEIDRLQNVVTLKNHSKKYRLIVYLIPEPPKIKWNKIYTL